VNRTILCAAAFFVFLMIAKLICATDLALFGDEAFYFQCARRFAIAYSDHPFMTAAFVRGGLELLGPTTLGTRSLFLLVGFVLPFLVFRLARPHVGTTDALLAAASSLVVPATAWIGVLAIPDAPLMLWAVCALLFFDHARRTGSNLAFALAGLMTAAALATHLRAVLVPFGFFLYLVLTTAGRSEWRRPGIWIYAIFALPGFLPVLLFNLELDWKPLQFQGQDRHQGGASFDGFLEHIPLQMAACTPLLYVAMLGTLFALVRRARGGDATAQLFALFSLAHLGVFFVTSPIADTEHATIHWPAPGYLPLLVFLPATLREFFERKPSVWRRRLVLATPALGAAVLFLAFLELAFHPFGFQPLVRPFKGHQEAAARVAKEIEVHTSTFGSPPLVVADHYILAGNLEQQLLARGIEIDLFVLDHLKNHEHGRALQFELWSMDQASFTRLRGGRDALVVAERNQSRSSRHKPQNWTDWEREITGLFESVEKLKRLEVESAGSEPRDFRFWIGRKVAVD